MKRILSILSLLLLPVVGYAQHDHGAHHAHAASPDSAAVVAIVNQFAEALAAGDREMVQSLLLPEATILESGGVEDRSHYLDHHYYGDTAFLQAMTREPDTRQVFSAGDVAWVSSTSRLHGAYKERDLDLNSAELMVLRRTADGWRIAAIHWSSRSRN